MLRAISPINRAMLFFEKLNAENLSQFCLRRKILYLIMMNKYVSDFDIKITIYLFFKIDNNILKSLAFKKLISARLKI